MKFSSSNISAFNQLHYGRVRQSSSRTRRSRPLSYHSLSIHRAVCPFDVHRRGGRKFARGAHVDLQRHFTAGIPTCVHQRFNFLRLWNRHDSGLEEKEMWPGCCFACSSIYGGNSISTQKIFRIFDRKSVILFFICLIRLPFRWPSIFFLVTIKASDYMFFTWWKALFDIKESYLICTQHPYVNSWAEDQHMFTYLINSPWSQRMKGLGRFSPKSMFILSLASVVVQKSDLAQSIHYWSIRLKTCESFMKSVGIKGR